LGNRDRKEQEGVSQNRVEKGVLSIEREKGISCGPVVWGKAWDRRRGGRLGNKGRGKHVQYLKKKKDELILRKKMVKRGKREKAWAAYRKRGKGEKD